MNVIGDKSALKNMTYSYKFASFTIDTHSSYPAWTEAHFFDRYVQLLLSLSHVIYML
jgi:hypothetical protein